MTARMEQITNMISDYADDSHMDGYHHGYDEAWDEARDKGFDEGWSAAVDKLMDMIEPTGIVVTPHSRTACAEMIEQFNDNGAMCVMLYMNWLASQWQR